MDIKYTDSDGNNCLHTICRNFHELNIIKYFVENCKIDLNRRNSDGENYLQILVKKKDKRFYPSIKYLVEKCKLNLNGKKNKDIKYIVLACKKNFDTSVIEYLIENDIRNFSKDIYHALEKGANSIVLGYLIGIYKSYIKSLKNIKLLMSQLACKYNSISLL